MGQLLKTETVFHGRSKAEHARGIGELNLVLG
jgi:hypothetical protein